MQMAQERTGDKRMQVPYRPLGELIRGIFFLLFGLFAFFAEKLGLGSFEFSSTVMYIFGGVLVLYGLFRIYRGVRYIFLNRG